MDSSLITARRLTGARVNVGYYNTERKAKKPITAKACAPVEALDIPLSVSRLFLSQF